jgi:hypothetical protein
VTVALLRIAALLALGVVWTAGDGRLFYHVYYAFSFPHFILGFIYARKQIQAVRTNTDSRPALTFLALLTIAIWFVIHDQTSHPAVPLMIYYFGIHNALSDAYVFGDPPTDDRVYLLNRIVMNLCLYFFLMRANPGVREIIAPELMVLGYGICLVTWVRMTWAKRSSLTPKQLTGQLIFEGVGVGMFAIGWFLPFRIEWLIFYHVALWLFIPVPKLMARPGGSAGVLKYLSAYAGLTLFFWVVWFSPTIALVPATDSQASWYFYLASMIHVSASFALSNSNPPWIRDRFLPVRAMA